MDGHAVIRYVTRRTALTVGTETGFEKRVACIDIARANCAESRRTLYLTVIVPERRENVQIPRGPGLAGGRASSLEGDDERQNKRCHHK